MSATVLDRPTVSLKAVDSPTSTVSKAEKDAERAARKAERRAAVIGTPPVVRADGATITIGGGTLVFDTLTVPTSVLERLKAIRDLDTEREMYAALLALDSIKATLHAVCTPTWEATVDKDGEPIVKVKSPAGAFTRAYKDLTSVGKIKVRKDRPKFSVIAEKTNDVHKRLAKEASATLPAGHPPVPARAFAPVHFFKNY